MKTFAGCSSACLSRGLILPTIENQNENTQLGNVKDPDLPNDSQRIWLGMLREGDSFTRMRTSSSSYTNFGAEGDAATRHMNCVVMRHDTKWDANQCREDDRALCVCEKGTATPIATWNNLVDMSVMGESYDNYFKFYEGAKISACTSWCQRQGWVLPTVESEAENTELNTAFENTGIEVLLGMINTEGTAVTRMTASTSSYTNWRSGEPNDDRGAELCVKNGEDKQGWFDESCAGSFSCVCKKGAATPTAEWAGLADAAAVGQNVGAKYFKMHQRMTMPACSAACVERGWVIPTVENQEENEALHDISPQQQIWVGVLNPHGKSLTRMTLSDSSYKNWEDGEPNDFEASNESCVHVNLELFGVTNGKWHDVNCWDARAICVCEKDAGTPIAEWNNMLKEAQDIRESRVGSGAATSKNWFVLFPTMLSLCLVLTW
eukprot:TRINITY_DN57242_c0_g1_i1.p1 TRINITY_DN57242_c0_g1~~TRINITY_DN57242_c0_g1_i1.p1  ORF type:complete len:435 (-),score=36.59 TRINITY_DN57242_c0_g1_i1:189-1493(-)